ncbi:MAG: hypothetical protein ACD_52C00052G0004 [uncultured bacterium]|nr:MAG: hypothetical protein ACD_52C00052G0004 [uncultured bacterium]
MDKTILKASERKLLGRKVKALRAKGMLPGVVFGKGIESLSVAVDFKEFTTAYSKAGETGIVELTLGSSKRPVLIHNVQVDTLTGKAVHTDFLQVNLKEEVNATVAVELVGESPAEKSGLGTIVVQLNEIEVRALPLDLPEKFVVDVSSLTEVDQAVYVKDLAFDKKKIEIKTDLDSIVVKVEPPQKEEVVEAPKSEEVVPSEVGATSDSEKEKVEAESPETTGDQTQTPKK